MAANPFLGLALHATGGLAAASFYIPLKRVKNWEWETFWLAQGFFSWIVAPWVAAMIILPQSLKIICAASPETLFWTWLFGVLWGIGGLTFGMTMRYLGIALGYAIALGLCAMFGTLVPPLFDGTLGDIASASYGQVTLCGFAVCLAGIALSGKAGISKERELSDEQKQETVKEFNFIKGLIVAVIAGVLSASMSFAFNAAEGIKNQALAHKAPELWQGLPALIVALFGGFVTNCIWCFYQGVRKRKLGQFLGRSGSSERESTPVLSNYAYCALGGTIWYLQFFFYSMGETQMGADLKFTSWTLHMASIIIFSTLWGIALKEWKGTGRATRAWIGAGLIALILSTLVVGYGNKMKADAENSSGETKQEQKE